MPSYAKLYTKVYGYICNTTFLLYQRLHRYRVRGEGGALNVYTGQNPRRRVVSVKTSQMRTLCTLIWRESCLLVYIFTSAFILG
jgi:hypothetical protein